MKLILKEYINSLREEGELDALLVNLLREMKMTVLSKPKKGPRQYGVDILAKGADLDTESIQKYLYIFVVKRGNITRQSWNSGPDAVKQSLDDVLDIYLQHHLTPAQKVLPKKIVLASNGDIEQTVQLDWSAYANKHSDEKLEFHFWGIEEILLNTSVYLLSESLFPEEHKKLLTKTLAFLDTPDYDLRHFYILIDKILAPEKKVIKRRMIMKARLLTLCCSILQKWCNEVDNLKHSVFAYERALLKSWNWLRENNMLNDGKLVDELKVLRSERRKHYIVYVMKIKKYAQVKDALFRHSGHNHEYRLLTFEQIGLLSSFAISEMNEYTMCQSSNYKEGAENALENAKSICNVLIGIIENNDSSSQPLLDEHMIDIGLGLFAMSLTENLDYQKIWLHMLTISLEDMYHLQKFFPLFDPDFDKLAEIKVEGLEVEISSSTLFTLLLDYTVLLNMRDNYELLKEFKAKYLPKLNLQTWFPDMLTEDVMYDKQAERDSGAALHSIDIPVILEDRFDVIKEEANLFFAEKDMSFMKYALFDIGAIACRHYRTCLLPYYWRFSQTS